VLIEVEMDAIDTAGRCDRSASEYAQSSAFSWSHYRGFCRYVFTRITESRTNRGSSITLRSRAAPAATRSSRRPLPHTRADPMKFHVLPVSIAGIA